LIGINNFINYKYSAKKTITMDLKHDDTADTSHRIKLNHPIDESDDIRIMFDRETMMIDQAIDRNRNFFRITPNLIT